MTDDAILALFRTCLVKVSPERGSDFEKVTLDTPFEEVRLDSLTMLEMVGEVEKELNITFDDDDLESIDSLRSLAVLTQKLVS